MAPFETHGWSSMAKIFGGHLIELTDSQVEIILNMFEEMKSVFLYKEERELHEYLRWVTAGDTDVG